MKKSPKSAPKRRGDQAGFTLIEILVGMGVIAVILGTIGPVVLTGMETNRRLVTGAIPALIAESLRDAIRVGAQENYSPVNNRFFFDFEGVRVQVPLPGIGGEREDRNSNGLLDSGEDLNGNGRLDPLDLPYAATPRQGLYPLGIIYVTADHMVLNNVDLGKTTDESGNVIQGRFIGLPWDEDQDGDAVLDTGEDSNNNCVLDTGEDTNGNNRLDGSENANCSVPLVNPLEVDTLEKDSNGNGILDTVEDLNKDGYWTAPDKMASTMGHYLPYRSDPYRNYGYTLEISRPGIDPSYQVTIRIFSSFFQVRRGLESAPYAVLKAYAEPEVGLDLEYCSAADDDDGDGINDLPVYDDKPVGTNSSFTLSPPFPSECPAGGTATGTHSWEGTPETLLNGVDDDGDGKIDDGAILPVREMVFFIEIN